VGGMGHGGLKKSSKKRFIDHSGEFINSTAQPGVY
jgi:hypothetical protein